MNFIACPDQGAVRRTLPKSFEKKFRDCICIVDCSKIFTEKPKNLMAPAQTWSNYKHNNTIKYLVWVILTGLVRFISSGWVGRVTEKQISLQSAFIKNLIFDNLVLGDRIFNLHDEIVSTGAVFKIHCFIKGKSQLLKYKVYSSRQLSNVRIHGERVIGLLKNF